MNYTKLIEKINDGFIIKYQNYFIKIIYKYIDEYLYKDNIILHPETLLYHHLKKHNINIISFDYNYDLNINRSLIK